MITYYCPVCWQEISQEDRVCPACGFELSQYKQLSYEEKLLLSLDHPVQERRLMAIKILGNLGSQSAVPAFARLLQDPHADVFELRECLEALSKIQGSRSLAVIRAARRHPYPLIRRMADELFLNRQSRV